MHAARTITAILVLGLLLSGCSQLSVRHLDRNPWSLKQRERLELKFWRFSYEIEPGKEGFRITGTAYPRMDAVPPWATEIEELWLAAYLSDARGRVVAEDLRIMESGPLSRAMGVDFEFLLEPESLEPGELYVTFGYRMTLSGEAGEEGDGAPDERVFFGSESAMTFF